MATYCFGNKLSIYLDTMVTAQPPLCTQHSLVSMAREASESLAGQTEHVWNTVSQTFWEPLIGSLTQSQESQEVG